MSFLCLNGINNRTKRRMKNTPSSEEQNSTNSSTMGFSFRFLFSTSMVICSFERSRLLTMDVGYDDDYDDDDDIGANGVWIERTWAHPH